MTVLLTSVLLTAWRLYCDDSVASAAGYFSLKTSLYNLSTACLAGSSTISSVTVTYSAFIPLLWEWISVLLWLQLCGNKLPPKNLALCRLGSQVYKVTRSLEHSASWLGVSTFTRTYTIMRCLRFMQNQSVIISLGSLFMYPTVTVFWNVKPLPSFSSCSIRVSVASSSLNKTSVFPEKCKNRVTSPSNPPLRDLAPLHSFKAHTTWRVIRHKERKQLTWNTGNPIVS